MVVYQKQGNTSNSCSQTELVICLLLSCGFNLTFIWHRFYVTKWSIGEKGATHTKMYQFCFSHLAKWKARKKSLIIGDVIKANIIRTANTSGKVRHFFCISSFLYVKSCSGKQFHILPHEVILLCECEYYECWRSNFNYVLAEKKQHAWLRKVGCWITFLKGPGKSRVLLLLGNWKTLIFRWAFPLYGSITSCNN